MRTYRGTNDEPGSLKRTWLPSFCSLEGSFGNSFYVACSILFFAVTWVEDDVDFFSFDFSRTKFDLNCC